MEWIRPERGAQLKLGLRNLYILPSRFGLLWLLLCLMLWLLGTNGSSNGALLLAYAGLALFLLAAPLTQFNLQGLELQCGIPEPGFADDTLHYPLLLQSRESRQLVQLRFQHQPQAWRGGVGVGQQVALVPWSARKRGRQQPGMLRIVGTAPLGLFYCWSTWQPSQPQLIYPARVPGPVRPSNTTTAGSDDWLEHAPHRPEEGLQRLDWKVLARRNQRYSRRFNNATSADHWLSPTAGVPREQALQHLSAAIWRHWERGERFGLELDGEAIPPNSGTTHRDRCLRVLAEAA